MTEPHRFAVDIFRLICQRFHEKAEDLHLMAETTSSFEEWLNWEAFLACKLRQQSYPFCEVAAKPTYSSEGVADDGGDPDRKLGDLRVGGPDDGANHCWVFAEFALLHDGNRTNGKWQRKITEDVTKLKRLGWVNSISMLVVVCVSRGNVLTTTWTDYLESFDVWNRPPLTEAFSLALPEGGSLVAKAFDVKQRDEHVQRIGTGSPRMT